MKAAPATTSQGGAWARREDNWYGAGRFPFGQCTVCDEPACFDAPANDNETSLFCQAHLPDNLVFWPFLGQQTKLWEATERWVLGGGGAGGSKTYVGARLWIKQWNHEQRRYLKAKDRGKDFKSKGWALFMRRTMPELLQVIDDFLTYFRKVDPGAHWLAAKNLCTFSNGYKVQFAGMEDENDYLKYYGGAYTLVVADEAVMFTKKQLTEIDKRVRCADPVLDELCQFYYLTNPIGGETKQYLKETFVRAADPETRIPVVVTLADGRMRTEYRIYIPCNLYDNPSLVASGRYEASLMTSSDAMRRALLLNDWDVDEGTWLGADWNPLLHICNPFPIPKSWPKYKCGDWGFTTRGAVHWMAVDEDGDEVCYRSWSFRDMIASVVAQEIKAIESFPLVWKDPATGKLVQVTDAEWDRANDCSTVFGPMDAATWAKQGETRESRGEILATAGCGFEPSDKGTNIRIDAANQMRTRLRSRSPDARGRLEPGKPGIRFFRGTTETRLKGKDGKYRLTGPIHTLPGLPFDPKNPDVWDTNADDHDADAWAYGETSRPMSAERKEDEVYGYMTIHTRDDKSTRKIEW
jgi:hypothetical protein